MLFAVPASPVHVLWECPAIAQSAHPAIASTQNLLLLDASANASLAACCWLRGLLPSAWVRDLIPAALPAAMSYLGEMPVGKWPGGTY